MKPRLPTKDFSVPDDAKEHDSLIYYRMANKKRRADATWYRGESTNFHPVRDSLGEENAIDLYVGEGWFPPEPVITKDHRITAFGSCFAAEVSKFLVDNGYHVFGARLGLNAHVIRSGEGIVNSAALRQQFDWAFKDQAPKSAVWHDKQGDEAEVTPEIRDTTRDIFLETDVFIFTLGLSEVWFDKETNDIFWRAIPKHQFDPERHAFRVLSVSENRENLTAVYRMIRAHRPQARIIFTLSPIPLVATFRPVSCITANAVSKASLRVAIDELMREFEGDELLHYFPSYEMVTAFIPDPWGDDLRHPRPETIETVMEVFKRRYLRD